jgi:asparagine synthetase B (glutamine-hydrolysing)
LARSTLELFGPSDAQIADVGSARVVFSGAVDNPADLAAAVGFEPRVDGTEADLVLQAYLRSGESILPMLRGAFGLVFLDACQEASVCVRDPLGIYPLFTADLGDELLVSPSIESLLEQPGVSRQVNTGSAYRSPALPPAGSEGDVLPRRTPDPAWARTPACPKRTPPLPLLGWRRAQANRRRLTGRLLGLESGFEDQTFLRELFEHARDFFLELVLLDLKLAQESRLGSFAIVAGADELPETSTGVVQRVDPVGLEIDEDRLLAHATPDDIRMQLRRCLTHPRSV